MEEANENCFLALLTLRTPRRSVEAAPHKVNLIADGKKEYYR